jgi:hypothetical protein
MTARRLLAWTAWALGYVGVTLTLVPLLRFVWWALEGSRLCVD